MHGDGIEHRLSTREMAAFVTNGFLRFDAVVPAEINDRAIAEIERLALNTTFDVECTPSYYTSEGDIDNPWGIVANRYGGGPIEFEQLLLDWREKGELVGLDLRQE